MSTQPVASAMTAQSPVPPSATAHAAPILELINVSKSFATGNGPAVTILDDVNLQVDEGEMLALLGQSGSGKSTILRLLAGLAQPTSGQVHCRGLTLEGVNRSLSIVFQSFALYPWLTVSENVQIGLTGQRLTRQQQDAEIERAIELIGLSGYENAYPKELSGGMRQRVGFARAIVAKPEVLCMDEAFSALDVLTAENLRTEVVNLWSNRQGPSALKSIFFVTHNIAEAVFMATRIVIISSHPGRIKHVIPNPLPYPRDVNSKEFTALVDRIHGAIVSLALPDEPPAAVSAVPSHEAAGGTAAPERPVVKPLRVESIPPVPLGRVFGLLEILEDSVETVDLFELSHQIGKEFSDTIAIVKAAEMLDLVDTPKQEVFLTALGRDFLAADQAGRKAIFSRQLLKLRLFQIITGCLLKNAGKRVDADVILEELTLLLPYDHADKLFETVVAWGRYAELIDYDQDEHVVFMVEKEEKNAGGE